MLSMPRSALKSSHGGSSNHTARDRSSSPFPFDFTPQNSTRRKVREQSPLVVTITPRSSRDFSASSVRPNIESERALLCEQEPVRHRPTFASVPSIESEYSLRYCPTFTDDRPSIVSEYTLLRGEPSVGYCPSFTNTHSSADSGYTMRCKPSLANIRPSIVTSVDQRTELTDPTLLRGASFPDLVSGFGRLFQPTGTIAAEAGAQSAEDTFALSREVLRLQHFLSHSWRDNGTFKWLSLLWYINLPFALVAGHTAAAISMAAIFIWPSLYPAIGIPIPGCGGRKLVEGPGAAVGYIVFLTCILFGHNLSGAAPYFFLDKVCIHQTDPDRKAAGIRALGAYLRKSENFLCLWGKDYFDRIWCCYELGLFILLRGADAVHVFPIAYGWFAIVSTTINALFVAIFIPGDFGINAGLLPTMCIAGSLSCFQSWYKVSFYLARQNLSATLAKFDVRDTSAFCCQVNHVLPSGEKIPCDREYVEEGIQEWFGTDDFDGIDVFNNIVRTDLNAHVQASLGKETVLPLRFWLSIASLGLWGVVGNEFGFLHQNESFEIYLWNLLDYPWMLFVCYLAPDAISGHLMAMLHRRRLPGVRFWTITMFLLVLLISSGMMDPVMQQSQINLSVKVSIVIGATAISFLLRWLAK